MKRIFAITFLLAFMAVEAYANTPPALNTICPVMKNRKVKQKFCVDRPEGRICFCCRACVKSYNKHPEKYPLPSTPPAPSAG